MQNVPEIDSDSDDAALIARQLVEICTSQGALCHPGLRIEIRAGSARLLAPVGSEGVLISLPADLFVPAGANWKEAIDQLEVVEYPRGITNMQKELLDLHASFYNVLGKLKWWSCDHPANMILKEESVTHALEAIKPGWVARKKRYETAAEGFLSTRCFMPGGKTKVIEQNSVLLPIIDLMNHHHKGAVFLASASGVTVNAAQPDGTGECFGHYGRQLDVLDLAIRYGHYDTSTPYAFSAPMDITLLGKVRFRVGSRRQRPSQNLLRTPKIEFDDDGFCVSHLLFDSNNPARVRSILVLAIEASLLRKGCGRSEATVLSAKAISEVVDENRRLLQLLASASEAVEHPGGDVLAAASRRQSEIVAKFLT